MRKIRKKSLLPIVIVDEKHEDYVPDPYDFVCQGILIKRLIEDDNLTYIVKHFDELCKDRKHLPELLKYMSFWSFRIKDKAVLEKLKGALVYEMLYDKLIVQDDDIDKIRFMINEVAASQNLSFFDIRRIGSGSYSSAYELGDKIIKIGKSRATKIIDNNRLLLPDKLVRVAGNEIEITDHAYVGTASFEDTYEVYRDLRDQGIIWLDPWFLNLGRLDRTALESQNEKAKHKSEMPFLVENRKFKHRELKSSDYVIIDLDHFAFEDDKKTIKTVSEHMDEMRIEARKEFEKRYLLEKKKAI